MRDPDYDWHDDYEAEIRRKPRRFRCSDGYCGAEDCDRCRPNNGYYDEEENDHE